MDIGSIVAGSIIGSFAASIALGLGFAGARKLRSSYRKTAQEMHDEQRLGDYYNQQGYHQYAGGSNYPQYHSSGYYPSGYHSGHSYAYYR